MLEAQGQKRKICTLPGRKAVGEPRPDLPWADGQEPFAGAGMIPSEKPDAGDSHFRIDERRTGSAVRGAGPKPGAKATDKPPHFTAGAPAPDSAYPRQGSPAFAVGDISSPGEAEAVRAEPAMSADALKRRIGGLDRGIKG